MLADIKKPEDIKYLSVEELEVLAQEVRDKIIDTLSKTGGHLGANLGVVELTIALHHVFDSPTDKFIFDVGHQAYTHKLLTGRYDTFDTIRQTHGISGFTKVSENEHDCFGAGHSSTSISAGLGMACAAKHNHSDNHVISIIGDGSMSAGMAFEGLNNAGDLQLPYIVILNDNNMSIAPPTGALSRHFTKIATSAGFAKFRKKIKSISQYLPGGLENARNLDLLARDLISGEEATLFNSLGFLYFGPIDGHNIKDLIDILANLKKAKYQKPVLLHVKTVKGKGYHPAEVAKDRLHGVSQFDPKSGKIRHNLQADKPSWTKVFANSLKEIFEKDEKTIAITAAMPDGTGVKAVCEQFADRCYDVGIAEQHAVTFAAGLAREGMKPYVAIYSTFLQRAWDQIVHDVTLQSLPVRFMIDRAGFVGADGATHAGTLENTMLLTQDKMVLMSPSNADMLRDMVHTSLHINDRPSAIRYPRGNCDCNISNKEPTILEIGKGNYVQKGEKIALLSVGTMLPQAQKLAEKIKDSHGFDCTIIDACFLAPFDKEKVIETVQSHKLLIVLEENLSSGFANIISQFLLQNGYLDKGELIFRNFNMPIEPITHGSYDWQLKQAGLDVDSMYNKIIDLL